MSESLLGEHWTRASNVVVRRAKEEVKDDLYDFSPCSVELADFQLEMLEPPREERRKSRRISSLREKSEQDLQQLRMAPQSKSGSPMAPNQAQRPMRKARASKERIDPGHGSKKSAKVASMMRECLQIANFRLRATSREISEKLSATLQNTRNPRNPSVWPAAYGNASASSSSYRVGWLRPQEKFYNHRPACCMVRHQTPWRSMPSMNSSGKSKATWLTMILRCSI